MRTNTVGRRRKLVGLAVVRHSGVRLYFAQLGIIFLVALVCGSGGVLAESSGKSDYIAVCASCHGENGRGNGEAKYTLAGLEPTDLTTLSERNGGQFPSEEVYRAIDGRDQILGHEHRRMPMWGLDFQKQGDEFTELSEAQVKARISNLVEYIRSMQRK